MDVARNFRIYVSLAAMAAVMVAVFVLSVWQLGFWRRSGNWTIATGHPEGMYFALGNELEEMLDGAMPDDRFTLRVSAGSVENMRLIATGEVDFAFVQSDTRPSRNARLIATLYTEVVHIAVRADLVESGQVTQLEDLRTLESVSLGPEGSGTQRAAEKLLQHFEIEVRPEWKPTDPSRLHQAFLQRRLEAAFVLVGPGTEFGRKLFSGGDVELLSLGAGLPGGTPADAFAIRFPAFKPALLPARLYGQYPPEAKQTIGVTAALVASEVVSDEVVRRVTELLFERRNELQRRDVPPQPHGGHMAEFPLDFGTADEVQRHVIPLHPGADSFYRRERPSFLVTYAEVISLGITLLVGLYSIASLFLRWRADLKKERIDDYYAEIRSVAELPTSQRLKALYRIRERAFDELMAERLAANDAFVIFHDYVMSEVGRTEREAEAVRRRRKSTKARRRVASERE